MNLLVLPGHGCHDDFRKLDSWLKVMETEKLMYILDSKWIGMDRHDVAQRKNLLLRMSSSHIMISSVEGGQKIEEKHPQPQNLQPSIFQS